MVHVKVINGNIEKALQILKRTMKESRLFIDLREREQYTKPSEVRRKKKSIAKLREKYRVEDNNDTRR